MADENEPTQPDFGHDYDEAPNAKESDADFDAPEENAKGENK